MSSFDLQHVGIILWKKRKELNVSQEKLAMHSKVTVQTIRNLERNDVKTSFVVFLRICDYLHIDPKEIMVLIRILDEIHAEERSE